MKLIFEEWFIYLYKYQNIMIVNIWYTNRWLILNNIITEGQLVSLSSQGQQLHSEFQWVLL